MPNRIIKESAFLSDKIAQLSDFEFRLWVGLITQADDAGRGDARTAIIKGHVFALRDRVTIKDIDAAVHALAAAGCVSLYTVGGKPYYEFPSWSRHQRIRDCKPKYPGIDEADLPNCGNSPQIAADCGLNPIQSESNPNPNPKVKRAGAFVPPTLKEIEDYCRERNSTVDPKQFYDYFSTGDWKDAKGNAVKNWKQKLLTWEKYDAKDGKKQSDAQKHVSESFAKQSETEKLDYMKRMMQHIGGGNDNT